MRFFFYLFLLILPFSLQGATSYIDYDLDGVDDAIDQCPNTPFDVLVDRFGCDLEKKTSGKLTLQVGISRNVDSDYEDNTPLNLYLNYSYDQWDISISSANYNTSLDTIVDLEDDLYLTAGYTFHTDKISTRISAGTKFAFMQEDENDRDNDYYAAVNMTYTPDTSHDVFAYYSYTVTSDSTHIEYRNFHTFSLGTGYYINEHWYSALAYNYISPYYQLYDDDYQTLSWYNTYMLDTHTYIMFNYAYGLNANSYDHTFSISIGAVFE